MLQTCYEYVPRQSCIATEQTKNCRFSGRTQRHSLPQNAGSAKLRQQFVPQAFFLELSNIMFVAATAAVPQDMLDSLYRPLNFLLPGHSFMIVDLVHAVIEKAAENKTIFAPNEWNTLITNARYSPFPYSIFPITFEDDKDWKKFCDSSFSFHLDDGSTFRISDVQRCIFEQKFVKQNKFHVFYSAMEQETHTVNIVTKKKKDKKNFL